MTNHDPINFDKAFQEDDALESEELTAPEPPPRRGPGRPRKTDIARRRVVPKKSRERMQELEDELEDPEPLTDEGGNSVALFPSMARNIIKGIRVIRIEPNEGMLATIPDPTLDEDKIAARWGGGRFRCFAIGADGKIKATTTIDIAGDPIFQSLAAQRQWEKRNGLPMSPHPGAPAQANGGLDIKEILAIMQEKEAVRAATELQMQERMRLLQIEAEERRRRDDEERERRRRQDEDERERRQHLQRLQDEERARSNMQQMIALMSQGHQQNMQFMQAQLEATRAQASAAPKDPNSSIIDAVKMIAVIKDTFGGDGGGSGEQEENLMAMLVKHGPDWLNAAGNAIGSAVKEIKGGQPSSNPAPALAPQRPQNVLTALPPKLSAKAETFVSKLIAKGRDPEKELEKVLDGLNQAVDQMPDAGETAAPKQRLSSTPAPAPAPAAQPPRNVIEATQKQDGVVTMSFAPRTR